MLKAVVTDKRISASMMAHDRAMQAAKNYKRSEIELLRAIAEVEKNQIYLQMQIKNLYEYCIEMLELSEHTSLNFINVMRKSREVPELLEAISRGETTVSKARKICSVLTAKNQAEWIGLIKECSTRIIERCVAMANPRAAVPESMKYVSADTLEFRLAVSEEWSELLTEIKDLKSQQLRRAVSSEEALFMLMADYKKKNDPVLKAERARSTAAKRKSSARNLESIGSAGTATEQRDESRARSVSEPLSRTSLIDNSQSSPLADRSSTQASAYGSAPEGQNQLRSRRIPSSIMHSVNLRDRGRCTFVDRHGKRCGTKRWTELHHVQPFAHGGEHSAGNLKTLCWAHHCMEHRAQ